MQPHTGVYDCRVLPVGIRLLFDPWGRGPSPLRFSTEVLGSDRCADEVRLVREEILGWAYFISSKHIIALTAAG